MPRKSAAAVIEPAKTRGRRRGSYMSDEHKAALAQGREEGRVIRRYLEALEAHAPRRGRKLSPERVQRQLDEIDQTIGGADPLTRLQMLQQRRDLEERLIALQAPEADMSVLEEEFVQCAAAYGGRKGISYAAWREVGVAAETLRRAGVER